MAKNCPLCAFKNSNFFYSDQKTTYLHCPRCDFVFVPKAYHLSTKEEKSRYDLHQNDPSDKDYRKFLSKLTKPLLKRIKPYSQGLDFGCGPGPTLSLMLSECGHKIDLYDKFYQTDTNIFNKKYDFITATEVFEHLSEPGKQIAQLIQMLNANGVLAMMTKIRNETSDFASWYYKNDPTHIGFFSKNTFDYLAKKYQANLSFFGEDVIILSLGDAE